ncbi:MAG: hypothetical protein JNL67_09135 [Planctomycetaceae bacterium]|nr:hypothetical protein [Planctomycetaceae bacterium]
MKSQYLFILVAAAAALNAAGCSSGLGLSSPYSSGPRDMLSSRWRDHVWANRAYETRLANSSTERAFESDFRRGFVAGYQSISQGGDGTVPAMPPRKYWGSQYLSPDGQAKAKAWFEGFPAGVQAAQADGIDAYRDIYVSQLLEDVEKNGPGTKPEIGRHMKELPAEDRLPPQTLPEWTNESAPPLPATYNRQISYVSPEAASGSVVPHPMKQIDFASYQAAPRLIPTPKVPVVQPKVSRK